MKSLHKAALLLATHLSSSHHVMAAALDCPSELTQVTSLNNGALTLYTEVVVSPTSDSESILCARLESDSESWVGFGISPTGLMLGANTIIGVPAYGDFV